MSKRFTPVPPPLVVGLVAPPAAVLVACILSVGDPHVGSWRTIANVALLLAVLTVAAALVDWRAGIATSLSAALSLNYFHTEPLRTLRVTDGRDVVSIGALVVLGLMVSAVTAVRVQRDVRRLRVGDALDSAARLRSRLGTDESVAVVWNTAIAATAADIGLLTARLEPFQPSGLPTVGKRDYDDDTDSTLVIPTTGAALRLDHAHVDGHWLVIAPRDNIGTVTVDRRALLAFAATIDVALGPDEQR